MIGWRMTNWVADFERPVTREEIRDQVRKTERFYWISSAVMLVITCAAGCLLGAAREIEYMFFGLLCALTTFGIVLLLGVISYIRLAILYVIWDARSRVEVELERSRAEDL